MNWCETQPQLAMLSISMPKFRIPNTISNRRVVEFQTPSIQFARTGDRKKQGIRITMRGSSIRPQLQKGRNLSIEAIQTIQALKRAKTKTDENPSSSSPLEQVFVSKFKRLLKLDMMAVLRELLRQNECFLALKVFDVIRKEYWYKRQASLYAEIVSVLGSNRLFEKVELLVTDLRKESDLEPDIKGFNELLESLTGFKIIGLTMECFDLMKSVGCDPDRQTFKILINGLESNDETSLSTTLRQEAQKYYGESLDFLEEQEEIAIS